MPITPADEMDATAEAAPRPVSGIGRERRWPALSGHRFAGLLLLLVCLAATLRGVYPAADPPWHATVGIVWHDEGAWVHNARNRALFGAWRLDEWNPVFVAPVFTGLQYLSFRTFGVGVRQARLVSAVAGTLAVLLMGLGMARACGRSAGLVAAGLLATNYVSVMYDRAALMEATMVAWLVASWYCCARAQDEPAWGLGAGLAAVLAYFTKASAVFFLGALGLACVFTVGRGIAARLTQSEAKGHTWHEQLRWASGSTEERASVWVLVGLATAAAGALLVFVVPHWQEYSFYNWQMSVTRKPSYTLRALVDRASWFPIVHDFFTRMWMVSILAVFGVFGLLVRWRDVSLSERVLLLWLLLGSIELILHDVGNERRLVFLIPAMVAVATIVLVRDGRLLPPETVQVSRSRALLAFPIVLFGLYVVVGGIVRLPFLYEVRPGVRLAAAVAAGLGLVAYALWSRCARWMVRGRWTPNGAIVLTGLLMAGGLAQFGQWALSRTYKNYAASRALDEWLPPGTLVHGKLANGLSLENRIRPVFVGRNFGNYADRLSRPDVRFILTYVVPKLAYEGSVLEEVLNAYPRRRIVRTFDVAETTGGHDQAALIEK